MYQVRLVFPQMSPSSSLINFYLSDPEGALEIARRSRGTPRLANRLLKRVRDFAQVKYDGQITLEIARDALNQSVLDQIWLIHIFDRS